MPGADQGVYIAAVGVGQDPLRAREQALVELSRQYRGMAGRVDNLEAAGEISETCYDRSLDAHYALAVIAIKDAERMLSQNIDEADRQILSALREAWTTSLPLQQWGAYLRALNLIAQRDALAAQLMALSPSVLGDEVFRQRASVIRQAEASAARIGLDVRIANDRKGLVKKEIVRALAAYGVRLVPAFAANLHLVGTVVVETKVDDLGFPWYLVSCQIKTKSAEGAPLDVPPARVGRKLIAGGEAEREARRELGKMLAGLVLDQVAGGGK